MEPVHQRLDRYLRQTPRLGHGVYLARGARVIGAVEIGNHSSVWYNAVLRGDINEIIVGHHTNIQDNAVLHVSDDFACRLGHWVTVGHSATVHACTVGDEVLVGMGATILDGAIIGAQSLIGANALVTQGTEVPPGSLVMGSPARVLRALTDDERRRLRVWAEKYVANVAYCLTHRVQPISGLEDPA
jgi:carbonic anhydrase/acetyltransferase-like protein (isoleucine patch superfamily)